MQPFLEEINLNNDWINEKLKPAGQVWTCIELIQSFRNSGDLIGKPLSTLCQNVNTPAMVDSTYTGVVPSKIFHKYKIASSFLGLFKKTHSAQIARVKYVKMPSKGSIPQHVDGGPYYQKHNRFHLTCI